MRTMRTGLEVSCIVYFVFLFFFMCQCVSVDTHRITRTQEKFQGKNPKVYGFKTVPHGLKTVLFWNLKFNFWVLPGFWVWSYFPESNSGNQLSKSVFTLTSNPLLSSPATAPKFDPRSATSLLLPNASD